jgi:hypothetical protein
MQKSDQQTLASQNIYKKGREKKGKGRKNYMERRKKVRKMGKRRNIP